MSLFLTNPILTICSLKLEKFAAASGVFTKNYRHLWHCYGLQRRIRDHTDFFATVQNKLHFAIHGHTAAELIVKRANSTKDKMGLTTWRNAPKGKILKPDVVVAKNYLTVNELKALDRFVTMYLDYAEDQAERGIPMTMADWAKNWMHFYNLTSATCLKSQVRLVPK